jgi:16S rRNA (cytosine967-C5)-methyltransferase
MSISHLEKKATFWFSHITELIELWSKSEFTAASVKQRFMSGKRYLGSKDKKVISGVFFFYLRHKLALEGLSTEEIFFLAYLKENDVNESVNKIFKNDEFNSYIYEKVNQDQILSNFSKYNDADFFPDIFLANIDIAEERINSLAKALNQEATTDLRIISDRDLIEEELKSNEIPYEYNILKDCIKLGKNINFNTYMSYKNGCFEIQDEGSQLISILLDPKPDEDILDYCSGGGGKTIHIAEIANDQAFIDATDINIKRLKETERRVGLHRLSSVLVLNIEDVDSDEKQYDKVLIDAPCSGSGTVRRSPEIRYTITNELIDRYTKLQLDIIAKCYDKISVGGELIYSTCSLFRNENDRVISNTLTQFPDLELVDIKERATKLNIPTNSLFFTEFGLMTLTDKSKTDGFYLSILRKGG